LTPEEFRRHAHKFVDWMADFMEGVEDLPVRAQVNPGEIIARLPESPPQRGETMEEIFGDFEHDVMPGMTHWQHPRFFAYFSANASPPSVLAEMLTATLGAQCMLWQTSPAASEMEDRMMDWLRQMLGMPVGFRGVIQDSATSATLVALLCAREKATGWRANQVGLGTLGKEGTRLTVYVSEEAHSSIEKGLKVTGYGREAIRKIATDNDFAMKPEALALAIREDLAQGLTPACVVASLGGTGVGAIDPLRSVGEICRQHNLWLHVDAAWAGSALILPEERWMIEGIELADSFVFNPHKWLFTNFDCSAFYVQDPAALERTLALVPEYLKSPEGRLVTDYQNWSVPLGRRFRALKLWFVIRSYGVDGLRRMIRDHIQLARELFEKIETTPDFEILSPRRLSLFSFRYHPHDVDIELDLDRLNESLLQRINADGRLYLTQNRVRGRFAIRFMVGQPWTRRRHVEEAWEVIQELARASTQGEVRIRTAE
jgi:aromatic-L-amino-acid decarboxylase